MKKALFALPLAVALLLPQISNANPDPPKPSVASWSPATRGVGWITTDPSLNYKWAADIAKKKGWNLLIHPKGGNIEKGQRLTARGFYLLGRELGADPALHEMARRYPNVKLVLFSDNNEGHKFDQGDNKCCVDHKLRREMVRGFEETVPRAWRGRIHFCPYWNWHSRNQGGTEKCVVLDAYPGASISKAERYVAPEGQLVFPIGTGWLGDHRPYEPPTDKYLDRFVRLIKKMRAAHVLWFHNSHAPAGKRWQELLVKRINKEKWGKGGGTPPPKPPPPPPANDNDRDKGIKLIEQGLKLLKKAG